jgi:bacteriorhodopsin
MTTTTSLTIGDAGKDALWLGFIGMFVPTIYFSLATMKEPAGKKYFHVVTTMITAIASLAYLSMASGYGFVIRNDGREFFYARYIDWVVTTPLLLLDLAGLAGATPDTTLWLIGTDVLMIVAGLIGALIEGKMRWAFWGFGMLAFLPIVYFLVNGVSATNAGPDAAKVLKQVAILTAITWTAYPIVWAVGEGASYISADAEAIAYCVLDVAAKSGFGFLVIGARSGLDQALATSSEGMGNQLLDEKSLELSNKEQSSV